MLSYFPARDVDEPVTKDFLRAEMAELRKELSGETSSLRVDMERNFRSLQTWMVGTGISLGGLILATSALSG